MSQLYISYAKVFPERSDRAALFPAFQVVLIGFLRGGNIVFIFNFFKQRPLECLALVRRVLELFHGRITAESEVGRGSAFTVTLPRNNEKTRI